MKIVVLLTMLFLIIITKKEEKEFNYNWFQNDFNFEAGHIEIKRFNTRYVRFVHARSFKYNRTTVAHNVSVNLRINVGNDLEDRTYHVCNYVVNGQKLPPLLPTGDFMLELTFSFKNAELYVMNAYGKISRNITRK
ncbi:hypothetical protein ILUMI_04532 [Ignelater luminosus]|uniref:Uncharacterized protein n=1 Tax=Ignelater luminosus TaxID=2038154 RepID=A0A8K0DCD3_IGNLU|nr:hypothetical protein ILUMI_04532 [Ignelater luminosus]